MKKHAAHFGGVVLAAIAMAPSIALAQDKPAEKEASIGGDIVVTATRREESVQKVGIAINAYSGDLVETLGLQDATDLVEFAPGVSATGAQGGFLQTFSIRGVTQNDYNPHQEGPIAAYLDEAYISSVQGQSFSVFDTERVEILKGPQGTLFGRNATGGLVHYISRKPTEETEGYISGNYGRYNAWKVEGAVGGKLTEGVMARVAATYSDQDPILKNVAGPDQWDPKTFAARAHLLFKSGDSFEGLFSARYGKSTISISGATQYPATVSFVNADGAPDSRYVGRHELLAGRPCAGCNFFGWVDPDGTGPITSDPLAGSAVSVSTSEGETRNHSTAYGFTGNLKFITGEITITSITDYSHFDWRFGSGLTGAPAFPVGFDTDANGIKQFSTEFRISGDHDAFRWTAGAFYLSVKSDSTTAFGRFPSSLYGLPAGFLIDQVQDFKQNTKSTSLFGQVEYDLGDKVTAIAGIRYIHEAKRFDFRSFVRDAIGVEYYNLDAPFNPSTNPLAKGSDNLISWKLGLNYKANDDLLLYATANRGVKSAGFNAPSVPVTGVVPFTFKPERLMAYEAGFKSSLGDAITTLNGSVFYYDYKNYQAYRSLGFTNFIFNSDARTYGAELQLSSRPIDGLNLMFGAAYTNNKVKDVALTPTVTRDRVAGFAPRLEATGLIRYELPVSMGNLGFQLDGSYTSSYFTQITNTGATHNGRRVLLNGAVTLAGADDAGWQINAGVRNITNKRYLVSAFDTSDNFGSSTVSYNMPRTWDVGFNYKF